MQLINQEYRFKESKELNEELNEIINEFKMQLEGLQNNFMDVTLDPMNHKEKEWEELWNSPQDWFKATLIKERISILEEVVNNLNEIVYIEQLESPQQKKATPRLTKGPDCIDWLIDEVKPLVLEGVTKRKDIAKKLGLDEDTILSRVQKGYGCNWRPYVKNVQKGRY